MSVSVSCSLAHVEQGRSTCNVSRSLSVELFCFAACVCHVCLFRFLACSLTSSKDPKGEPCWGIMIIIITRVEMYVCFGFSLTRLRRARTIDLQCQSLSFRRAFLLRSVRLSCMSVAVSRSLAYVEQGRMTCNVSRSLSIECFCFAACVCQCA